MREHGGANGERLMGQALLAAACLVASLVFHFTPAGVQRSVASGIRLTLLRPFVEIRSAVSAIQSGRREADVLRARVDSLHAWITNNASVVEENRRLRVLSGLAPRVARSYRAASVYRPRSIGSQSTLVLDLGLESGVHAPSPIITSGGLVGRVIEAHASESIGVDWSHPDFRASVMSEDGELYGIVGPEPGAGQAERLVLNGVSYHASLGEGTLVVTSGRGGVFPRGVPVGRIGGLAEVDEGWHRSYWVYPSVHPASVTHALVGISAGGEPNNAPDLTGLFPVEEPPVPAPARGGAPQEPPATSGGH